LKSKNNILALLAVLPVGLFIIALFIGATHIGAKEIIGWIIGRSVEPKSAMILSLIRLPRALACIVCGAALALSGLTLQTSLNNPIVSPGIIGVNAGAGFMLVLASVIFPFRYAVGGASVLVGAIGTALLTVTIARKVGTSRLTIVLAGVAISAFCSAGMDMIISIQPDAVHDKVAFYVGSFEMVKNEATLAALPYMLVGAAGVFLLSRRLDLLLLGDDVAASLGVNTKFVRTASVLLAACLAAGAVSVCGLLGFVGLIVPHICRRIFGNIGFSALALASCLLGATLVLACDILARTLFAPYELPVGVFLSFIGAAFFLYLLMRRKRRVSG
jgi:iron complex transport system permease protein